MTWIFSLTQLETRSKAFWQTGVNLIVKLVSSTMDIVNEGCKLQRKIDKLERQKNNTVLTKEQKDNLQKEIDKIKEQIAALESKLTDLTKLVKSTHQ